MQFEKSCGAICYSIQDNKLLILLVCHKFGKHWSYPKGHIEKDETELETARREVLEETGISIEILDGYREVSRYYPQQSVTKDVVYFVAKAKGTDIILQTEELKEAGFFDSSEILQMLTYPTDKTMLKKALLLIDSVENTSFAIL